MMKTNVVFILKQRAFLTFPLPLLLALLPLSATYASERIISCYKKELYSINVDGTGLAQLTNFKVPGHAPTCKNPSQTSTTGDIFWSYDPEFHGGMSLFKMQINDKNIERLTPKPKHKNAGSWETSVSPNGKFAVFSSKRTDNWQIYKINTRNRKVENISQTQSNVANPRWSANNQQIVYVDYAGNNKGKIYVMNADGSDKKNVLIDLYSNEYPAWSPDGKTIAYTTKNDDKTNIWTIELASGKKQLVTSNVLRYTTLGWSENSNQLVFVDTENYLNIVNIDGNNRRKVINKRGFYEPFWN